MELHSFLSRLFARALLTVISFQLLIGTQLATAQTAPVQTAPVPANGNATMSKSANGTPVVNIATPNSAGVSHNTFNSYNVGAGGLILNNSSANAISVIGGGTAANANLAGGKAASLILNEVVTPNSGSLLAGYQEILGPSAELVIANPWGVTCNGCGFVNTPRVTLTTGVPNLTSSGALGGFTITGGQIAIGANGLDASRQSTLDLLARSISVGGNVIVGSQANGISGDLQLLAGTNSFDYATRTGTAIAGTGAAPQFAIDSSVLGGMYADRIRLLVTEQGAGVRVAGNLAALGSDLTVNAAEGRIELRGAASAARDLNVTGTDIQVDLADSNTYLFGGRDLALHAGGTLELDTGSIGAQLNLGLTAGTTLSDLGGANDLRFSAGSGLVSASAGGALNLSGGYWTAPRLSFSGDSVTLSGLNTLYGSDAAGTAVSITTPGLLSVTGGKLYSNSDANLSASKLEVDSAGVVAATGALTATVGRGASGGVDNAGVLQGDTVNLTASGDAPSTATTFHNATSGTIVANNGLSIGESGAAGTAGSTLANDGTIAGGSVNVSTTDTANTNAIQASKTLNLASSTVENTGKNAVIIGSTDAAGSATISAASIMNSGTIWSAGDLSLAPTTLTQQRASDATQNPLIGAGRDLSVAYTGTANLGAGDLQAGRNLTITGTSIQDRGGTGLNGTTADVRYAGGNLVATAAPGGNVSISGGQWFSQGDLRLTGDTVNAGFIYDPATAITTYVPLQIVGAQSGSGTLAITARTGYVDFVPGVSAYSGNNLSVSTPQSLFILQGETLQATNTLSLNASTQIENFGTVAGGNVVVGASDTAPLLVQNQATGLLAGKSSVQIGTASNPVNQFVVEAPAAGSQAGVFGGRLDVNANTVANFGLIQGVGPGSVINAGYVGNHAGAQLLGFTDANNQGGLTINTPAFVNEGLVYDSSNLTINSGFLENFTNAAVGSAGVLKIVDGTPGLAQSDNQGQIWANYLDLTFNNGLTNGRDPGDPANRTNLASIYSSGDASIKVANGSTLNNFGTIEAAGNLQLQNVGGAGSVVNQMGMVPDSELVWITDNQNVVTQTGDLGLVTVGANGSTSKQHVTVGGTTYYWFDQVGGSTDAYFDGIQSNVQNQALNVPASSIPTPTIRAGGNLDILGFQNVSNNGLISGAGNVTISSTSPGSIAQNTSLNFGQRDIVQSTTEQLTCRFDTGVTNLPTSCAAIPNNVTPNNNNPYFHATTFTPVRQGNAAFTGKVLAGGTLTISAGNIVNSGTPGAFTVGLPGANVAPGTVTVTAPNAANARGGATTLTINGAQVPLPTSSNGRFVTTQGSTTAPLVETNPLFGIDSLALGSDYLTKLLGLNPDQQARRLGDSSYEDYLIQQQVSAVTGLSVLGSYASSDDMIKSLFDNAAGEAKTLNLGYGKALTADQVASLKSDIVWLVEEQVQGQKVLVPVVYLSDATRAATNVGAGATLAGYNVNLNGGSVTNAGGDIQAINGVNINATGNIENLSGRVAGWNVQLNAGGDIVNSTLVSRVGDATNGIDVAQRTAGIEAGNTAILKAGHDINVNGAWVTAAKDAALIAGNSVNVQSVALTTNQHNQSGGNYETTQTQTAQGAGIVAGNNAVVDAGKDVNLKGVTVSAGNVAAVRAEKGNVNVGALDLTNTNTTSTSSSSFYTEANVDKANTGVSAGFGVETKTTTHTDSTTNGLGSAISGNQVAISTGQGDVNINGSSAKAGTGGLIIDSGGNVNITAYQNKSTSTDTTDTLRVGVQAEANADGAYYGAKQAGTTQTATTQQSTAQTSNLTSGGDLLVNAKKDVTNEGTQFGAAGDLVLQAQDVINKAAQNTTTTTTATTQWETKEQAGLTTNGTGQSIADAAQGKGDQVNVGNPEIQQRITGSYSNDTNTQSQSQAVGTQLGAGGNVVVLAQNHASDEGSRYIAGKDVVISAADYVNKAAENVTTSTDEQTSASGKVSVGVDVTASVNINASGEGSHTTTNNSRSTAQLGGINAGGAVLIQAKSGDVTLEGTQINADHGVGIDAAKNINIKQANDKTTNSSSEQSGSAHASVSVSLVGAGAAVGAGSSTRLAQSDDSTSTARTASINSGHGDVQLNAGGNLTSEGANIAAGGNVGLKAGGDINLLAATDKTDKTGFVHAGGADVNVGFGTGEEKAATSGGVSVNFEDAKTDYHESTQHGSTITAGGHFSVDAGGNGHLVGTQVNAGSASLKTGGNLTIESARHTISDDSHDIGGTIGLTASKGGGTGGAAGVGHGTGGTQTGGKGGNAGSGNAQVEVGLSKQDVDTNTNASINTRGGTTVDVGGDLGLKGANINAQGGVSGKVAGNLDIETRTDKVNTNQTNVTAYAGLGPVGGNNGGTTGQRVQEGVSTGANHIAQDGAYTNVDVHKKDDVTVGTASGISGGNGGINVSVGGNTTLTGATNSGADFKTRGQTTIAGVQTHTNDQDTTFKFTGTVASAAGSKDGSGGNYGLTVHVPHGGEATAPKPNEGAPHEGGPSQDEPVHSTSPRGVNALENEPNVRGFNPTVTADNQVVPRRPQEPQGVGANGPRPIVVAENGRGGAAHEVPVEPQPIEGVLSGNRQPGNPAAHAQDPEPYHSNNEPQAQRNNVRPVQPPQDAHPVGGEPAHANAHEPGPVQGGHSQQQDRQFYSMEEDDNAANPEQHLARIGLEEGDPQVAPGAAVHGEPGGVVRPTLDPQLLRSQQQARVLIDRDPAARQLSLQGAHLDENEKAAFDVNLGEIIAFTNIPAHASQRAPLLAALEDSLHGPRPSGRDPALTEFPLHPQYVGENTPDFANWFVRRNGEEPGTRYDGRPNFEVPYLTPEQQQQRRVYITDDGALQYDGRTMENGEWIFVVNQDGELVADRFQVGQVHHSSLSGGKPVLMAGEFEVSGGKITFIANKSGHFRPDTEAFKRFLVALGAKGADLSQATAPSLRYEVDERGRFKTVTDVENLLHEPDVQHGVPTDILISVRVNGDGGNINPVQHVQGQPAHHAQEEEDGLYNGDEQENGHAAHVPAQDANAPAQHVPAQHVEVQDANPPARQLYGNGPEHQPGADGQPNTYASVHGHVNPEQASHQQLYGNQEVDGAHAGVFDPEMFEDQVAQEPAQEQHPAHAEQQAPVVHVQPMVNPHAWTPETRAAVEHLVSQSADVHALYDRAAVLPANDQTFFDRNLAEIVAFTDTPQGAQHRAELLNEIGVSLNGPQVRPDGETEFPLLSQFVGEDVRGFDNWYSRRKQKHEKDVPGSLYGANSAQAPLPPVHYLSESEREEARVYIQGGKLVDSNGTALDGDYIFVVDQQGRLIASPPHEGVIHHSSLGAGKPVLAAGTIKATDGKIETLSNQSGHYRPSTESFEHLLVELEHQGVSFDPEKGRALAVKLKTDPNGGFSWDGEFHDLLKQAQPPQPGPGQILAPLALPPAHAHQGPADNQPTAWRLPGWMHVPVGTRLDPRLAA
jgi:filamentous hemagglutinin